VLPTPTHDLGKKGFFYVELIVSGLVTGVLYALVGMALSLIYRSSGTLNLAAGSLSSFATFVALVDVRKYVASAWLLLLFALIIGGVISALCYLLLARVENRSPLSASIASLGVALIVDAVTVMFWGSTIFPAEVVSIPATVSVLGVRIDGAQLAIIVVGVILSGVLALLLRTPLGLKIRAVGQGPQMSRALGISVSGMRLAVWVVAGVLAAAAATIGAPEVGLVAGNSTVLLVAALAGLVIGGFDSLVGVAVGCLLLGIIQNVILRYVAPWAEETAILGIVTVVLLVRPAGLVGLPMKRLVEPILPYRAAQRLTRFTLNIGRGARGRYQQLLTALAVLVASGIAYSFVGFGYQEALTIGLAETFVVISLYVCFGLLGELSLGQGAFCAIGAYVVGALGARHFPLLAAVVIALAAGAVVGALVGAVSVRVRSIYLAIFTVVLASAVAEIATNWTILTGGSIGLILPSSIFGLDLSATGTLFVVESIAVAVLLGGLVLLRYSRFGQAWILLRDSGPAAQAAGISIGRHRVYAFALSGAIAALGGIFYVEAAGGLMTPTTFDFDFALYAVAALIIGGATSVTGVLLGGLFLGLMPQLVSSSGEWADVIFGLVLIGMMYARPDGLGSALESIRFRGLRRRDDSIAPNHGELV
jgi:sulfate-transporting ATPase